MKKRREYKYSRKWIVEQLKDVNPYEVFTYNIAGPLNDRADVTIGIATAPKVLHSRCAIGTAVTYVGSGRAVILCDDIYDDAPDNVKVFMELHEIGHVINGDLERLASRKSQGVLNLTRFLPWSETKKAEYKADAYAVSKIGKKKTFCMD